MVSTHSRASGSNVAISTTSTSRASRARTTSLTRQTTTSLKEVHTKRTAVMRKVSLGQSWTGKQLNTPNEQTKENEQQDAQFDYAKDSKLRFCVNLEFDQKLTASPGLPAAPWAPLSPYRRDRRRGLGIWSEVTQDRRFTGQNDKLNCENETRASLQKL